MLPAAANTVLCILVAVSGLTCIAGHYAGRPLLVYVFKPLTMLWVLAIAVQGDGGPGPAYLSLVVAGLVFSLAGDALLMLPSDRFAAGLASFLVAHLLYVGAFVGDDALVGPTAAVLPFALAGAATWTWLRPGLGDMAVPVGVYVAVVALMAGLASSRWLELGSVGAGLACAGAALFAASDAALAANRFRTPFAAAQAVVLGSYFTGQCLIALSTGVGEALLGRS